MFERLKQDIGYALRTLRKSPIYALVAMVTLALGIGANTAIFSVINGVLLKPLPFTNGERVVYVQQPATAGNIADAGFSPLELADYRQQTRAFDELVEYHSMSFNLIGRSEPHRVQTGVVSANYFDVLGIRPLLGRTFRPGEDEIGAAPVLVLSHEFWRTRLGADPTIVGQTVEMTDRLHLVVGILPPLPQFPDQNDVFMPVSSCPFRSGEFVRSTRTARMVTVFGLRKPGVQFEQARQDLQRVSQLAHAEYPDAYPQTQGYGMDAIPLKDAMTATARPTLLLLVASAAFVLLIACANVANLMLVRFSRRHSELVVRSALGADRKRLVQQLLTESTILSLAGAALGLAIAFATRDVLSSFAGRFTARAQEIQIDPSVLGFATLLSLITGLAFGTLPVLASVRNLSAGLRTRGGGTGAGRRRLEHALVVAQLAVSVVLLVAAGLAGRSLLALRDVQPGFDVNQVMTMRLTPSRDRYTNAELTRSLGEELLQRAQTLPGVRSAAFVSTFPLNEGQPFSQPFQIDGRALESGQAPPRAETRIVSRDYFATIGVPVVRGRGFSDDDRAGGLPVVLVNESLARRHWPDTDPIGARVSGNGQNWATVVGVVGDVRQYGLDREPVDEIYRPHGQVPILGGTLLLRSTGNPSGVAQPALSMIRSIDPTLPVDQVQTLEQLRADSLAPRQLTATLLSLFAILALIVAAVGMGGMLAYNVSQRTQEIGLRMAIGANRGQVLAMMLRQSAWLIGLGLSFGVGGALLLSRFMGSFVYGITTADPTTFIVVCGALAVVGLLSCAGPVRRAVSIAPIIALRSE